ncbi:hypothetical protein C8R46DRAFT_1342236 [Mycena filopes]|nr:hypothetical protein C8R46DRAFT_1342236 [Mycena filopes]
MPLLCPTWYLSNRRELCARHPTLPMTTVWNGLPLTLPTLPNEILGEIFRLAAGGIQYKLFPGEEQHPGVPLSHVCRQWREVARSIPIWNRVAVQLDAATYASVLSRLNDLFSGPARGTALNNVVVDFVEGRGHQGTSRLALVDIVQPYASRFVSLLLFLDINVIHDLVRLPGGTFPNLRTLDLTIIHRVHPPWKFLFGDADDEQCGGATKMSDLAPGLSSFSCTDTPGQNFTPEGREAVAGCDCDIYPENMGLDLANLTSLTLRMALGWWRIHPVLRHCVRLEECHLNVFIDGGPDDTGDEEEDMSDEEKEPFELPSLRSLGIRFKTSTFNVFFRPLRCPALTELIIVDRTLYNHPELMAFLRRSGNQLSSLTLHGISDLTAEDLTELFTLQPAITHLNLSFCEGTFWDALARADPLLLPGLEEFVGESLVSRDVQGVMDLVHARYPPGTIAISHLRAVVVSVCELEELRPAREQRRALKKAIKGWRKMGMYVGTCR